MDPNAPLEDLRVATDAHRRLLADLDRLVVDGALDVSRPSRLPGWTVGHVLTHVINSGLGHLLMLAAAAEGRVGQQYPHGVEGRAADIEAGAPRPAGEQVAALRASSEALEAAWAVSRWEGSGLSAGGEVAIRMLPFLRAREVSIHHVDLDIGFEFTDLDRNYLRHELRRMEMLWRARQPMGLSELPPAAAELPEPERLAWLMGRTVVDGLEPAGVF